MVCTRGAYGEGTPENRGLVIASASSDEQHQFDGERDEDTYTGLKPRYPDWYLLGFRGGSGPLVSRS